MAISKSFFGLRSGSTTNHTYAIYNGQQITKDRAASHPVSDATRKQAEHFAEAARFYPFVKKLITRSDYFRLAQDVKVEFVSANSIPIARWPMAWGLGERIVATNFVTNPVWSIRMGILPEPQTPGPPIGLWGSPDSIKRWQLSWFFAANRVKDWAVLIFDVFYSINGDDNVYRHRSIVPFIFDGHQEDALLKYPQLFVDSAEDSITIDPFGDGTRANLQINTTSDQGSPFLFLPFPSSTKTPVAVGLVMVADGLVSKSTYLT